MSLGTKPLALQNTIRTPNPGSAGIWTRHLPGATLEDQAQSLSYEDTESLTESLSDEDAGSQTQGSTNGDARDQAQAQGSTDEDLGNMTQSWSGDTLGGPGNSLGGPDTSDSNDGLFAPNSSDEREALELDYEAFRTIITLLALIQTWPDPRRSNKGGFKVDSTSNEKQVLKICNSLAVLAVIQREVIAIGVDYQLDSVKVIVSASLPLPDFTKFDLLVNKNPRHAEYIPLNKLTEAQLTINPQMPTGLKVFAREFAAREFTSHLMSSTAILLHLM